MPRPGKLTADGQRWVYRLEGHRKCWFQAAEGTATVKKPVHHRAARNRVVTPDETETAEGIKRTTAVDARAELPRSAPAETSQPNPAPASNVVAAGPVLATLARPAPVPDHANDEVTPNHLMPRQVDVEALLAAAPAARNVIAAPAPSATPVTFPTGEAGDDGRGSWVGVLLMALGLVSVLSSSRSLRAVVPLHQLKLSFTSPKGS